MIRKGKALSWRSRCATADEPPQSEGHVVWSERVEGETFGSPVCTGDKLFAVDKSGKVFALAAADIGVPGDKIVMRASDGLHLRVG